MKSILDPTFRYRPSVETDLRKTFARVRREQRGRIAAAAAAQQPDTPQPPDRVVPLIKRRSQGG